MSLFAVGAIFLVLGLALVLLRALNRFDDVYSRLPHDRDLQELFRHHMRRAQKMEEELTRWVLGEVDPDYLAKVHGVSEQEALDTAMCLCCLFGLGNAVAFLIEQGARIDVALCDPAAHIIFNLARKRGIGVREMDLQGSSALHMCALCGHPELTELLCKLGADPSRKNKHGSRPFVLVSQCSASNCFCISNKVWSFGCRTGRTRRVLRSALARQLFSGIGFVFPALFDSLFGFGSVSHLRHDLLGAVSPFLESHEAEVRGWLSNSEGGNGSVFTGAPPPPPRDSGWLGFTSLLSVSGFSALLALAIGVVWGEGAEEHSRHLSSSFLTGQIVLLSGLVATLIYIFIQLLFRPTDPLGAETTSPPPPLEVPAPSPATASASQAPKPVSEPAPPPVAPQPASTPIPPVAPIKPGAEKEVDRRIAQLEVQWAQADLAYETGKLDQALTMYTDIAGGVLRWLDQDRFKIVRTRQRECAIGLAKQQAKQNNHLSAVRWYCDTLGEHVDNMPRDVILSVRMSRDRSLLQHLRSCSDPESCAHLHASLMRMNDVQRPACVDAQTWAAWKKKDKTVLAQLLEARMEQLRDSKARSSVLLLDLGKYETALKACDKKVLKVAGGVTEGMEDANDLAVEILLWMAEACEGVAVSGHSDACISACRKASDHVQTAVKLMEGEDKHVRRDLCATVAKRLQQRLEEQQQKQLAEAEEAKEVERVLEEQRRLEEEARAQKKREQEERQRKAREERQRKEQEKKVQQAQVKEEAVRKKAEEAAAKKKEAEERRRREEQKEREEEAERERKEAEERRKAEAAEKALAQAIAEARARKEKEAQEKEKEKEREKEREREKALREAQKSKEKEKLDKKKEEEKKKVDPKVAEKEERHKISQLLQAGQYKDAVGLLSKLIVTHGPRLSKAEQTKLVNQQRSAVLQCLRQPSSQNLGLFLQSSLTECRDIKKDPIDEVLVLLALGEMEEALQICEKAGHELMVAGINLKAETLVWLAGKHESNGRFQFAVQSLQKAGKVEPSRRKTLESTISKLQERLRPPKQQQVQAKHQAQSSTVSLPSAPGSATNSGNHSSQNHPHPAAGANAASGSNNAVGGSAGGKGHPHPPRPGAAVAAAGSAESGWSAQGGLGSTSGLPSANSNSGSARGGDAGNVRNGGAGDFANAGRGVVGMGPGAGGAFNIQGGIGTVDGVASQGSGMGMGARGTGRMAGGQMDRSFMVPQAGGPPGGGNFQQQMQGASGLQAGGLQGPGGMQGAGAGMQGGGLNQMGYMGMGGGGMMGGSAVSSLGGQPIGRGASGNLQGQVGGIGGGRGLGGLSGPSALSTLNGAGGFSPGQDEGEMLLIPSMEEAPPAGGQDNAPVFNGMGNKYGTGMGMGDGGFPPRSDPFMVTPLGRNSGLGGAVGGGAGSGAPGSTGSGNSGGSGGQHKRSESQGDMGLDEILSMPWLGEDSEIGPLEGGAGPGQGLFSGGLQGGRVLQMPTGTNWSSHGGDGVVEDSRHLPVGWWDGSSS